ncbi:MAG: hypothetical protein K0U68_06705 [Gammaproteobacteria bacterium]|nr:hypothetical protein [Gammaproteobacteria bacterium]
MREFKEIHQQPITDNTPSKPVFRLVVVASLLIAATWVNAATIFVDSNCSIDEALKASQDDKQVGMCSAGSGVDTIVLPANSNYIIQVKSLKETNNNDDDKSVKSTVVIRG